MRKHAVMKMHNEDGVLYRTLYEKDPFYGQRRIFIPTTGLNNIERPIEDILAEKVEEFVEDVKEGFRKTAEDLAKIGEKVENAITEWIENEEPLFSEAAKENIQEYITKALDKLK